MTERRPHTVLDGDTVTFLKPPSKSHAAGWDCPCGAFVPWNTPHICSTIQTTGNTKFSGLQRDQWPTAKLPWRRIAIHKPHRHA